MNTSVPHRRACHRQDRGPVIGIVDDDPIMGELLVQRLQLEGYRASWWQSGEEALCHLPRRWLPGSGLRHPSAGSEW